MEAHGPRKLRVTVESGLVFGTLSHDAPRFADYVGPEIMARLRRVLHKKLEVIGRFTHNDSLMGAVALVLRRHGRLI